jgi:hypothetical protein
MSRLGTTTGQLGRMMSVDVRVKGFCPMGCGETLELSIRSGEIRCTYYNEETDDECPQPYAVSLILSDAETEHIVNVDRFGRWNMKHPLRERVLGELLECEVGDTMSSQVGVTPGKYRTKHGRHLERIDD